MGSYAAAAEVLGYRLQVTGSFQFSVPCRSKGAKSFSRPLRGQELEVLFTDQGTLITDQYGNEQRTTNNSFSGCRGKESKSALRSMNNE